VNNTEHYDAQGYERQLRRALYRRVGRLVAEKVFTPERLRELQQYSGERRALEAAKPDGKTGWEPVQEVQLVKNMETAGPIRGVAVRFRGPADAEEWWQVLISDDGNRLKIRSGSPFPAGLRGHNA
jgi:hypothetical protein